MSEMREEFSVFPGVLIHENRLRRRWRGDRARHEILAFLPYTFAYEVSAKIVRSDKMS